MPNRFRPRLCYSLAKHHRTLNDEVSGSDGGGPGYVSQKTWLMKEVEDDSHTVGGGEDTNTTLTHRHR